MTAMPLMIGVLCVLAIAYRYYSAFLAAKVAVLDETRPTPAVRLNDGQNYHPTSKWVLFGHHFAAISGAGPLIGPVLAAQFGFLPGLLWIVVGVCLGGAVQDFLVLAMSTRRNGKSLAQIAVTEVGPVAGSAATIAIIAIVVVALAGLGKVVVKALGGETVKYPDKSVLVIPATAGPNRSPQGRYTIPAGSGLEWGNGQHMTFTESFPLETSAPIEWHDREIHEPNGAKSWTVGGSIPPGSLRLVPGSSWGTFTIAATIPIALFVGFYMYRLRKGKTVEASIIGGALTIGATVLGGWIAQHEIGHYFNLSAMGVTWSMAVYGFIAAVLPVWVLLAPRDYLSSFLKIGTIALLVGGVLIANPKLEAPAYSAIFASGGGPAVKGSIFPFLFITIMCGAISGFHALVSSGTTPKMITSEKHARTIGYGAMLIEGLVGVCALIAAAALPVGDYYAMNTELGAVPTYHDQFTKIGADVDHLNVYEARTQEALRGRTSGAVTLAVGMAHIFDGAAQRFFAGASAGLNTMWKYWYHFAIMFEALFILTTIDAGTRIGRFLLQEVAGKVIHPKLGDTSWWPGAIVSTLLIVVGWAWFMNSDSFATIWTVFGISNQLLAVIALAVVSAWLVNEGRAKYLWVTVLPLMFVIVTTISAGVFMIQGHFRGIRTQLALPATERNVTSLINSSVQAGLLLAMLFCGVLVIIGAARRIWIGTSGPGSAARQRGRGATPLAASLPVEPSIN